MSLVLLFGTPPGAPPAATTWQPRTVIRRTAGSGVYRRTSQTRLLRRMAVSVAEVIGPVTEWQPRTVVRTLGIAGGVYRVRRQMRVVRRMAVRDGVVTPPGASPLSGWLLLLGVGA
jgi:hypothetical protein